MAVRLECRLRPWLSGHRCLRSSCKDQSDSYVLLIEAQICIKNYLKLNWRAMVMMALALAMPHTSVKIILIVSTIPTVTLNMYFEVYHWMLKWGVKKQYSTVRLTVTAGRGRGATPRPWPQAKVKILIVWYSKNICSHWEGTKKCIYPALFVKMRGPPLANDHPEGNSSKRRNWAVGWKLPFLV